jgi:hypothetical protein
MKPAILRIPGNPKTMAAARSCGIAKARKLC